MKDIFLSYLVPVGFIIWGIYLFKVWKRPLKPNASKWDKSTHRVYLTNAIGAFLGGIIFLVISIIHACTGWVAK